MTFTVQDRAHSSSKKSEGKVEETDTLKKGTTLIVCGSIMSQLRYYVIKLSENLVKRIQS